MADSGRSITSSSRRKGSVRRPTISRSASAGFLQRHAEGGRAQRGQGTRGPAPSGANPATPATARAGSAGCGFDAARAGSSRVSRLSRKKVPSLSGAGDVEAVVLRAPLHLLHRRVGAQQRLYLPHSALRAAPRAPRPWRGRGGYPRRGRWCLPPEKPAPEPHLLAPTWCVRGEVMSVGSTGTRRSRHKARNASSAPRSSSDRASRL